MNDKIPWYVKQARRTTDPQAFIDFWKDIPDPTTIPWAGDHPCKPKGNPVTDQPKPNETVTLPSSGTVQCGNCRIAMGVLKGSEPQAFVCPECGRRYGFYPPEKDWKSKQPNRTSAPWRMHDTQPDRVLSPDGHWTVATFEHSSDATLAVACVNALAGLNPEAMPGMVKAMESLLLDLQGYHQVGHRNFSALGDAYAAFAKVKQ